MKRFLCVLLAGWLLFAAPFAFAQENGRKVQLGTSALFITLGSDFVEDTLSESDLAGGMTAYYYNEKMDIAVCQYDAQGYTVEEYAASWASQTGADSYELSDFDGIQAGRFSFETTDPNGKPMTAVCYLMEDGGDLVEVDFYMGGDYAAEAAAIMDTLTR